MEYLHTLDGECMRYHAADALNDISLVVKVDGFGGATYGFIIDLIGTYNANPARVRYEITAVEASVVESRRFGQDNENYA
jgi:hypothetical protein